MTRIVVARLSVCRTCGADYVAADGPRLHDAYTGHDGGWTRVLAVRHCGACRAVSYARRRDGATLYATPRAAAGVMVRSS